MNRILAKVVTEGTGKHLKLERYEMAGKTGTAQLVENGVYSHSRHAGLFVGYAPVSDPRVLVLVVTDSRITATTAASSPVRRWPRSSRSPSDTSRNGTACASPRRRRSPPRARPRELSPGGGHRAERQDRDERAFGGRSGALRRRRGPMGGMRLNALLKDIARPVGAAGADPEITGVAHDSRAVRPGTSS